jgi:hypothetical protein
MNIPATAPHVFKNTSGGAAHMLCMCTSAGQEEFFMEVGDPLGSRVSPPPRLDKAGKAAARETFSKRKTFTQCVVSATGL